MKTYNLDLTKLRPGDFIFTLGCHWRSLGIAAATGGLFSHTIVVVYPDVWFETDGRGSGYRVLRQVRAFRDSQGEAFVVPVANLKLRVRRLKSKQPHPHDILTAIRDTIALEYPHPIEFLPLLIGFRCCPAATSNIVKIVRRWRGRRQTPYCSQLILKTMKSFIPDVVALTQEYHISPVQLYRRLGKHTNDITRDVLWSDQLPTNDDRLLLTKFRSLTEVTERLADYQYPHNKEQWDQAIQRLFQRNCLVCNPGHYAANLHQIQSIIADPKKFKVHDHFWCKRFR